MNDMRRVHAEQLVSSLELSLPPVAIAPATRSRPTTFRCLSRPTSRQDAVRSQATSRSLRDSRTVTTPFAIGIHTHNLSGDGGLEAGG